MKQKILHYAKEIIIFFVVITLFANIVSVYKSSDLNKEALSLTNITLLDGSNYPLETNKPILIHIWATWCPTCNAEASNIEFISKHYDVVSIAVKSGSNNEIKKWMDANDYTFNVVNDESGLIASHFNIGVFPTTFIYDAQNNLVFSEVGYTSTWGLFLRMWWATL
jgi:thiol-disulfide isomerase/thioredoxin